MDLMVKASKPGESPSRVGSILGVWQESGEAGTAGTSVHNGPQLASRSGDIKDGFVL